MRAMHLDAEDSGTAAQVGSKKGCRGWGRNVNQGLARP